MSTPPPRVVVVLSSVRGHGAVRNDVVVFLERAPNCGGEPAGSTEDVRKIHVLQVRLGVAPDCWSVLRRTVGRRSNIAG